MNPRRRITWLVYAACVALLAQGLGWMSWQVVRLEQREAAARAASDRQDAQRLALWRMDSVVAPLIARESARPYFHYRGFVPAARTYESMWQPAPEGTTLNPSPLLTDPGPRHVRLHFLIDPDGTLSSPQAPGDDALARAGLPPLDAWRLEEASTRLRALGTVIADLQTARLAQSDGAVEALGFQDSLSSVAAADPSLQEYNVRSQVADLARNREPRAAPAQAQQTVPEPAPKQETASTASAGLEAGERSAGREISALKAADDSHTRRDRANEPPGSPLALGPIRVGSFDAAWLGAGTELVLVRDVLVDGVPYRQGVWLDWPALRADLLAAQADLFPASGLAPILTDDPPADPADAARRLATIPARYLPGGTLAPTALGMTPARWSLVVTWIAVLAATIAIGVVLNTAIQLSDRRGRFVSAVTHELRTPLTTFRLYAQMLADGMVTDDTARAEYLSTLKRESTRLSGIVENVLEYARLSRRATGRPKAVGPVRPDDLLLRLRPGLSRRAEQGGMDLIATSSIDPADPRVVHVDPQSVERILTNLVDNACKYAAPDDTSEDAETRIHLDARLADDQLEIVVSDYGPGVPPAERARIFGEFRRGIAGARADRSGLGLGLALSRALAREAGGDLRLTRRRSHGAEFLLTLPLGDS